MPANSDNLDLDDAEDYENQDIKDSMKLQLNQIDDSIFLNVNNRILIEAQNKVGNRWMNMIDESEFSANSPKFGNELDIVDGEENIKAGDYNNADISDYLKQMKK